MQQLSFGLLLFAFVFLNAQCDRDDCEVVPGGKRYNARVPVNYSPMQERFKIGDTITIEINVPNEVKDTLSGDLLQIRDVAFDDVWGGDIGGVISRFFKTQEDSTRWIYGAKEFDYIQQKGKVQVTGGSIPALAVTFSREADKRAVKFQIMPQKNGIYSLSFFTPRINVTNQVGNYCAAGLQLHFGDSVAYGYHLLNEFDVNKVGTYQQRIGAFTFVVEE